jgi:hypothetical protein
LYFQKNQQKSGINKSKEIFLKIFYKGIINLTAKLHYLIPRYFQVTFKIDIYKISTMNLFFFFGGKITEFLFSSNN